MNELQPSTSQKIEILSRIEEIIDSGMYILGKNVSDFEGLWAQLCGVRYCTGVANGMDAIEISLRSLNIGPGDEVITTSITAFASVLAIIRSGAKPVIANISEDTGLIDLDSVKRCITKNTKAVLLVHLYGNLSDPKKWVKFCEESGIYLIEDCAQSHLASFEGQYAGSFGEMAAFSFYPTKNLGAIGDAGATVTSNEKLDVISKSLRNYGQSERYQHPLLGLNSRLDEIQAAILINKCEKLDSQIYKRRLIATQYNNSINNVKIKKLAVPKDIENHVYHLYAIRCENRNLLQKYLLDLGIQTLSHYPVPIHKQVSVHGISVDPAGMETSERFAEECLSIPCHPDLNDFQVQKVIEVINGF